MNDQCCKMKTVSGTGGLAGKYLLSRDTPDGAPAECMDKCVYEREGDSSYYCFKRGGGMMSQCGAGDMEMVTGTPPVKPQPTKPQSPVASNKEYCALSQDHTMCKYPGPSNECAAKTLVKDFTEAGKKKIVEKHNELRRRVAKGEEPNQPKAANMREMVWNDELAAIAQRWADQCTFGHDKNRKKLDGTYVGQNAYMSGTTRQDDLTAIMDKMDKPTQAWYDEVTKNNYDPANIDPFKFDYKSGHYTQVVWAESEELGCGQVMFKDGTFYKTYVMCNYAKGGNMMGAAMYDKGDACSKCPSGYRCNDGLCAKSPSA